MSVEESIQQIETLIEAWQLDEADLNQTDINAMQVLLKENEELKLQLKGTTHCFDEEEHEKLKKQLEEKEKKYIPGEYAINEFIKEFDENILLKNQQKEFIDYMNKTIEELQCDDVDDEEMKGYLIQRIDTFKEILQKYKSIIGVSDEKK